MKTQQHGAAPFLDPTIPLGQKKINIPHLLPDLRNKVLSYGQFSAGVICCSLFCSCLALLSKISHHRAGVERCGVLPLPLQQRRLILLRQLGYHCCNRAGQLLCSHQLLKAIIQVSVKVFQTLYLAFRHVEVCRNEGPLILGQGVSGIFKGCVNPAHGLDVQHLVVVCFAALLGVRRCQRIKLLELVADGEIKLRRVTDHAGHHLPAGVPFLKQLFHRSQPAFAADELVSPVRQPLDLDGLTQSDIMDRCCQTVDPFNAVFVLFVADDVLNRHRCDFHFAAGGSIQNSVDAGSVQ